MVWEVDGLRVLFVLAEKREGTGHVPFTDWKQRDEQKEPSCFLLIKSGTSSYGVVPPSAVNVFCKLTHRCTKAHFHSDFISHKTDNPDDPSDLIITSSAPAPRPPPHQCGHFLYISSGGGCSE